MLNPRARRAIEATITGAIGLGFCASVTADWNNPQAVGYSFEQFSAFQSLAIDSNGYAHLTWKNWANGPTERRYSHNRNGYWIDSAIPWGGLSDGGGGCLLITPDDVLHLFVDSSSHVYEYTKPASGGSWSAPTQVTPADGGGLGWAAVDANGGIYVVYVKIRFDPNRGTAHGRYKPLGGSWGTPETVRDSSYGWPSFVHVRAIENRFYIGYNVGDTKPLLRIRDNGTLGPERTLATLGTGPTVVCNPNNPNELAGVYGNDWQMWIVLSSDNGVTWTSPWNFSPFPAGPPQLAGPADVTWTPDGYLHVIWERQDGATDLFYRHRSPTGSWSNPQQLNNFGFGNSILNNEAFFEIGNDLHIAFASGCFYDDFWETVYMTRGTPTPPDVTGTLPIMNLETSPGNGKVVFEYKNPADLQLGGVAIRYKPTGYPTGPTDGILAGVGGGSGAQDITYTHWTTNGVTHYYALFPYDQYGNYGPTSYATAHPWMRSDFDKDGDVDLADFAHIQTCMTGTGVEQTDPDCFDCRLDFDGSPTGDRDVDINDLNILLNCLSGEDVYAPPACDPG